MTDQSKLHLKWKQAQICTLTKSGYIYYQSGTEFIAPSWNCLPISKKSHYHNNLHLPFVSNQSEKGMYNITCYSVLKSTSGYSAFRKITLWHSRLEFKDSFQWMSGFAFRYYLPPTYIIFLDLQYIQRITPLGFHSDAPMSSGICRLYTSVSSMTIFFCCQHLKRIAYPCS